MMNVQDNAMQGEVISQEVANDPNISEENLYIIKKRSEKLLGKTIQGTLVATTRSSGKTTHWIRWNKRKCDAVLVRSNLIAKHFGENAPMEGSQIMCTITALGPDLAKLAYKSAWCMHPQCNDITVLSNGYPTPPKRKSLQNKELTASECIVPVDTLRRDRAWTTPERSPQPAPRAFTGPVPMVSRSRTNPNITLSDRVKRSKQSRPRFFNSKIPDASSPSWKRTPSQTSLNRDAEYVSVRSDSLLRRCAGAPFSEEG